MLGRVKNSFVMNFPTAYQLSRCLKGTASTLLYRKSLVENTYGSNRFKIHIHDPIARAWYNRSFTDLPELDVLRQHGLRDGTLVFDLGAHQNVVAMVLAKEAGPSGKVIAVEGSHHNATIGRMNAQTNGIANLTTVHAVVGAAEGHIAFSQSFNGEVVPGKKHSSFLSVPAVTIDGLARKHGKPEIIIVDIEGYEMEAIRGAPETLKNSALWLIELHGNATLAKFNTSNKEVADLFATGYKRFFRYEDDGSFYAVSKAETVPTERFWMVAVPMHGS